MKCFVLWCKNSTANKPNGVSFHRIPEDKRDEWFKAIKRPLDLCPNSVGRICSEHFTPECFLITGKFRTLKPYAFPTLRLTKQSQSTVQLPTSLRIGVPESWVYNLSPESLVNNLSPEPNGTTEPSCHDETDDLQRKPKRKMPSFSDSDGLAGSPRKRRRLVRMFHNYCLSPKAVKANGSSIRGKKVKIVKKLAVKRLPTKIINLKQVIRALKKKDMMSEDSLTMLDSTVSYIPRAQMRRLVEDLQRKNTNSESFPPELRSFAMTLKSFSSKAYMYVKKAFGLALPAPSTIRKWLSNSQCEPGFVQGAFETLKRKVAENTAKKQKTLCCLMSDEMDLFKDKVGYVDFGTGIDDDGRNFATQALVLMVVSLTENWKIPIAYFLTYALRDKEKANIIKNALEMLSEINVTIVSVTPDGPMVNFNLAQELGAKLNMDNKREIQPYFLHPITKQKVYIILETKYLLQSVRNNWAMLKIIIDKDGKEINFQYIKKLYETQETISLRVTTELWKYHVEWTKLKMKVKLADQTLSSSIADALEFCCDVLHLEDFQHVGATVKFIRTINRLSDLCNSKNAYASGYKGPLRKNNEIFWSNAFKESIDYLKGLKNSDGVDLCLTRNSTPIKGFIVTATSLGGVYDTYIKTDDSVNYLLTHKMSQDHLGSFFFTVRSQNGNRDPMPFEFVETFKTLMLHHDIKEDGDNCLCLDSTTILTIRNISKPKQVDTSIGLSSMKRYESDDDFELGQEFPKFFHTMTENGVTVLAGLVVKKIKSVIKCERCLLALEVVVNNTRDDCPDFRKFSVSGKNRGVLVKPSNDVVSVIRFVESEVEIFLGTTDDDFLKHRNFFDKFNLKCYLKFQEFNMPVFSNLDDHCFDYITFSENHTSVLIKLIIKFYMKFRFHEIVEKQREIERRRLITEQLALPPSLCAHKYFNV